MNSSVPLRLSSVIAARTHLLTRSRRVYDAQKDRRLSVARMCTVHARSKTRGSSTVESLALESPLKYRVANAKGAVHKNLDSSERVTGVALRLESHLLVLSLPKNAIYYNISKAVRFISHHFCIAAVIQNSDLRGLVRFAILNFAARHRSSLHLVKVYLPVKDTR